MDRVENALAQLREVIIQQKSAHLPELQEQSRLGKLHELLAAYEVETTLRVRAALQRQPSAGKAIQAVEINRYIQELEPVGNLSEGDQRQLRRYVSFKKRLDELNALVDRISTPAEKQEGNS